MRDLRPRRRSGAGAWSNRKQWRGHAAIDTALQEPQLGTGHAVMQAVPQLDDNARP
jgi:bifunctional UDP-N-acetylglucosamine pyrophosphorylase/glucosamine-1-phosphate N-acetyltransferase